MNLSSPSISIEPIRYEAENVAFEYCRAIDIRLVWILGIIGLMWMLEPVIKYHLDKNPNTAKLSSYILFIYKWIGLGLIFIVGLSLILPSM